MGEKYNVDDRIRGGSFVGRLNPEIVCGLGDKHPPMPMVYTNGPRTVPKIDAARLRRIDALRDRFKK